MELVCSVQKYDWGIKGKASFVAQIANLNSKQEIKEDESYAEFWMGVHPSGPSRIKASNQLLSEFVEENPLELGEKVVCAFGANLPYLLKVLSVRTALSLQVHPSKQQAQALFSQYPDIYKDPNHKPELAIALTKFEALCSFRPLAQILSHIRNFPELVEVVGEGNLEALHRGELKPSFTALMECGGERVADVITKLLARKSDTPELELMARLNDQFPNDVGVLCVFWLNYVTLAPGEALFLGANEPHAYISGDCVECMANSDNVVRAGLTPKFRDVGTLCDMLTYKCFEASEIKLRGDVVDGNTVAYIGPVEDFGVARSSVAAAGSYTLKAMGSASIVLVTSGRGETSPGLTPISAGTVLFLPANQPLTVTAQSPHHLVLFRAFCNV